MILARHRWTACIVSALLLLQAVPLAVWVGGTDHASHHASCGHCNGAFCLRSAHRPCTKCAHHRAASGAPGSGHEGHVAPAQSSPSALHAAPASMPNPDHGELCGCGHQRAPGSLVPAFDKVVLPEATRPMPLVRQRQRFLPLRLHPLEARAEEPFHPPRTIV